MYQTIVLEVPIVRKIFFGYFYLVFVGKINETGRSQQHPGDDSPAAGRSQQHPGDDSHKMTVSAVLVCVIVPEMIIFPHNANVRVFNPYS